MFPAPPSFIIVTLSTLFWHLPKLWKRCESSTPHYSQREEPLSAWKGAPLLWLRHQRRSTKALAMAAMPSPRPVKPIWSVVVAVTDTGQPTAADNAASASARRVPIFGRLRRWPRTRRRADSRYPQDGQQFHEAYPSRAYRHHAHGSPRRTVNQYRPDRQRRATHQSRRERPHHHRNHLRCPHIGQPQPVQRSLGPANTVRPTIIHVRNRKRQTDGHQSPGRRAGSLLLGLLFGFDARQRVCGRFFRLGSVMLVITHLAGA